MVSTPLAASGQKRNARILLVDDDPALLEALPETLRLRLYQVEVECCLSPLAALALLHREQYDVVLTDLRMPEMDGLTLVNEIKQVSPATSVLVMTGHGDQALVQQAVRAGAVDFLPKPFDRDTLTGTLKSLLRARATVS